MSKIAIVQRDINEKNLILFYVSIEEFMTDYWKGFCELMDLKIEVISEHITYTIESEYPFYYCSLKTFWLNIFKRIWKKKHAMIMERKKFRNLITRQIYGKLICSSLCPKISSINEKDEGLLPAPSVVAALGIIVFVVWARRPFVGN